MPELRKCIVKDRPAYFHKWSDKSEIVPPSHMIGGHGGRVITLTVGIVEYEDGTVHECYPSEVRFTDRDNKEELQNSKKECAVYNSELLKCSDEDAFVKAKLIKSGFDLDEPVKRDIDFVKGCIIFSQEIERSSK
jgi:hypothetical protein